MQHVLEPSKKDLSRFLPMVSLRNGFACSLRFVTWLSNVPRVKAFVDGLEDIGDEIKIVYAIAFASFVVMIAGSIACDDAQDCKDEIAFVACPVISLLVTAAVIFMGQNISKEMNASCLLLFLAIWWFIGISVLTFEQPFVIVGNGFAGFEAGLNFPHARVEPHYPARPRRWKDSQWWK